MSKPKGLSWRASQVLLLISERSDVDWGTGEIKRYWVPSVSAQWSSRLSKHLLVGGSGDASILKGLSRRGLIKRPHETSSSYSYVITEDGLLEVERILAAMKEGGRN